MNHVKLSNLLTKTQLTRVLDLMQEHPSDIDLHKALREYFGTFGEELTKKGMLPSYAAYAIPYAIRAGMLERKE